MLTKLTIRKLKMFENVEIELGHPVLFIGPNNSGKTTALQALALWDVGLKKWLEKRGGLTKTKERTGVTINRKDLVSIPIPNSRILWHELIITTSKLKEGKQDTQKLFIEIGVEGINQGRAWSLPLEFYYANEESFYTRPVGKAGKSNLSEIETLDLLKTIRIAFLPPMSGLASNETYLQQGAINVRIGEGRTAEVMRNLCFNIFHSQNDNKWEELVNQISRLFGCELLPPTFISERGEVELSYKEKKSILDISASGRGMQQVLLLLAYMYSNPDSIILLDEPDAHLETLRQREVYQLLSDVSRVNNNQIIAATHSEVLLNEACEKDLVIAFVGKPHRMDNRGSQALKALKDIRWDEYYQAELVKWVLYLEGSTDLSILLALAKKLNHNKAIRVLERPFAHYVLNQPDNVKKHFYGLKEAIPDLKAIAIFDSLDKTLPEDPHIIWHMWKKTELENYICFRESLIAYAEGDLSEDTVNPLFSHAEAEHRIKMMEESIKEIEEALKKLDKNSPWDGNLKVSEEFLEPVFKNYFSRIKLYNIMAKKNFHELALYVPSQLIDPEITLVLDKIVKVSESV
jgi:ABC-type lipoprotein export system ATPase subunit